MASRSATPSYQTLLSPKQRRLRIGLVLYFDYSMPGGWLVARYGLGQRGVGVALEWVELDAD